MNTPSAAVVTEANDLRRALALLTLEPGEKGVRALEDQLERLIRTGHEGFEVGDELSAKIISDVLGVERRPVHLALNRLADKGYVDVQQGRPAKIVAMTVDHLPAPDERAVDLPSASDLILSAYSEFTTIVPDPETGGSVRGLQLDREETPLRKDVERALHPSEAPKRWLRMLRLRFVVQEGYTRLLFVELLYIPEGVRWRGRLIDELVLAERTALERNCSIYSIYKRAGLSLIHGSQIVSVAQLPAHARVFLGSAAMADLLPDDLAPLDSRTQAEWLRVCGTVWAKQITLPMHRSIAFFNPSYVSLSLRKIKALAP